ncbi:MAG: twitching motility protein PilT [Actinobacteria bacterium]|nr:twitching motility protein PilT [Actinomycetota bacterium]
MRAILDAGALAAVDRRNRMMGAQLRILQQQGTPIRVSSAVVGQVWRDGRKQANLARVLRGVGLEALAQDDGKRIGELLKLSGSADIVDAHVALITADADFVLTSDPGDIRKLLQAREVSARVQAV